MLYTASHIFNRTYAHKIMHTTIINIIVWVGDQGESKSGLLPSFPVELSLGECIGVSGEEVLWIICFESVGRAGDFNVFYSSS